MLIKVYGRSCSFFFPGVAYRVVFLVKQKQRPQREHHSHGHRSIARVLGFDVKGEIEQHVKTFTQH